ncbi:MAG: L-histidine N(alpha)-methyltransferase [Planctomycetota bacterium]|nr:L-histidine N(alpha)-methyltransferase [Planctomycetota bacterium]
MSTHSVAERITLTTAGTAAHRSAFADDVRSGLAARPKRLSCRYFYDAEGSRLFEEICDLPEYYLTRAEREILERYGGECLGGLPDDVTLVELGSGSGVKTRLLIDELLARQDTLTYVPVDISSSAIEESSRELVRDYAHLEVEAVVGEYAEGLAHLHERQDAARLILWLGSNVGNLDRTEAAAFLKSVPLRRDDRLLLGVDLEKERDVLEAAYDDSQGVTARFNKNLLARINRDLGGEFDLDSFRHRAVYDAEVGRVEMYLVSQRAQEVRVRQLGLAVPFAAEESIHTENSHKYSPRGIDRLARDAGLRVDGRWFDEKRRFSVNRLAPARSTLDS